MESTPVPSQTIRTSRSTEDFQLDYIKPSTSSKLNGTKKIGGDSKVRKEIVAQDLKLKKEQEKAGINAKEDNDEESLDDSVGDSNKNSHISNLQLLKPKSPTITEPNETPFVKINPEDEERVLRLMGWRPEEEDHIPELTEEEIREIKSKMNLGKNKK